MPNAVLDRLLVQRQEQIAFIDQTLERVEAEGRDLVDAETANLDAARQRIRQLTDQITPLEDFEQLRNAHADALPVLPTRLPAQPRRGDGGDALPEYRSAGEYVVDLIRARGFMERNGGPGDPAAMSRIGAMQQRIANQTTTDTPGILPTPIVGPVVNLIDANRPLISSLGGAKALGNIPGKTFTRPKITQHTSVGPQAAEKTELASQKMTIGSVPFTKGTYGGTVDISRQDIDWTSPAAWDILVRDLANVYSVQTETVTAGAFKTAATGTAVAVAEDTLEGWATALYTAAARSYSASFMMPDRVWVSLDVWAALGSLVDVGRLVMPPAQTEQPAGSATLGDFRGDVIGLPRIVVPTFPAGTAIVGPSALYEVYEEVIGLLSVVEPSILGVTVAYGGYFAYGTLQGSAFVPLTAPAGLAEIAAAPDVSAPAEDTSSSSSSKTSSK